MRSELAENFSIQTPLFAFERVYRRTGPIRKICVFNNPTDSDLELEVHYSFSEHSWVQLSPVDRDSLDLNPEGTNLRLPPGQSRLQVVLNTDSSNFPYDRFRGRVVFKDAERVVERWLEISFEEIEELRDFEGYAAIDLGTSNSTVALYHLRRDAVSGLPWSPTLESNTAEVPSTVFIRDLARFRRLTPESASVGEAALREYRESEVNDPRSLQVGTKRLIGGGPVLAADAQGAGGYVEPLNVLYMLGRQVRERTQDHPEVKARLRRLMVTYPPTWDYKQIDRWKEVFRRLGFKEEELDLSLDEASAAGLFYIYQWTKDADSRRRLIQDLLHSWAEVREGKEIGEEYTLQLLSFDFGGGTTDLAFIQVKLSLFDERLRLRVSLKGSDSLTYGGDQVTLAVFRILKRRLAMALTDPRRMAGVDAAEEEERRRRQGLGEELFLLPKASTWAGRRSSEDERAREKIRENWERLERHICAETLPADLEEAVDALFPTRFWRSDEEPLSPRAKRNFGWLWEQAENMKKGLFRQANRRMHEISLAADAVTEIRGGLRVKDIPEEILESAPRGSELMELMIGVSVDEIYRCCSGPIEKAVLRARALIGDERVDRIVLSGQSSWIPLVRRLFMSPRSDGGFGLPPSKIEFDEENAKAAVCKGACLLRVMRDTQVGFDVDVSEFKANLLSDIFYKNPLGGKKVLYGGGRIDDLAYVQERPDPRSFARHLAVFHGSEDQLLGQFNFEEPGEKLPAFEELAVETCRELRLEGAFPQHEKLMRMRKQDAAGFARVSGALRDWPERSLIAWMEDTAEPGSEETPFYRYYLTRNRNLFAVRDAGPGSKRIFPLLLEERPDQAISPRENPFSGMH